jgi:hypothetical protein
MVRLSLKDGTPIVALERVMTPILPANAASSTISAPAAFFLVWHICFCALHLAREGQGSR